jgi:GNAT superfamily N-acetyltransferase
MLAGEVFFIAIRNGVVVGVASDYVIDGALHGTSVYVRGAAACQGIGSALLRRAEAHALDRSDLHQVDASLASVEFYKANGSVEAGCGETLLTTGRPIARMFMRHDLRRP